MSVWKHRTYTSKTGSLYQGGEGGWEQSGIDWDNGTKPILLWFKSPEFAPERFVVFKVPAGRHFQTILDRQHPHPGVFHVAHLVEERDDGTLVTEECFDMPITKRKETAAGERGL